MRLKWNAPLAALGDFMGRGLAEELDREARDRLARPRSPVA